MPAYVALLGMKWIPCAAHLMNLVVGASLDHVSKLVKRAAILVRFFKKSPFYHEKLLTAQRLRAVKVVTLKQRNNTRWNSVYEMISSLNLNKGIFDFIWFLGINF